MCCAQLTDAVSRSEDATVTVANDDITAQQIMESGKLLIVHNLTVHYI